MLSAPPATATHKPYRSSSEEPTQPTSRYTPTPPSASHHHLLARAAPVRSSTESPLQRVSPLQRMSPPKSENYPYNKSEAQPLSLVTRPITSPAGSTPKRPEVGSLKVKSAESLSPAPRSRPASKSPRPLSAGQPAATTTAASNFSMSSMLGLTTSKPPPATTVTSAAAMMIPTTLGLPPTTSSMPGLPPPTSGIPGFPPGMPGLPYHYLGLQPPPPAAAAAPGAPCTDPMCRDPSCPTYAMRIAQMQMMMGGAVAGMPPFHPAFAGGYPGYPGFAPPPPGAIPSPYAAMLHPAYAGLPPQIPGYPPFMPPVLAPPTPSPPTGGAHMCSWMQGREFCGRRFSTSEELMSHLRTHTSPSKPAGSSPEPQQPAAPSPFGGMPASALALLQSQAAQLRAAGGPQRSGTPPSTAESRYHPYGRSPVGGPASLHRPPLPVLP